MGVTKKYDSYDILLVPTSMHKDWTNANIDELFTKAKSMES